MNIDYEIDRWIKTSAILPSNLTGVFLRDRNLFGVINTTDARTANGVTTTPINVQPVAGNAIQPVEQLAPKNSRGGKNFIVLPAGVDILTLAKIIDPSIGRFIAFKPAAAPDPVYLRYSSINLTQQPYSLVFIEIENGVSTNIAIPLNAINNTTTTVLSRQQYSQGIASQANNANNTDYDNTAAGPNVLYTIKVVPSPAILANMAAIFRAKMPPTEFNQAIANIQAGGTLVPGTVNMNQATVSFLILGSKKFSQAFPSNQLLVINASSVKSPTGGAALPNNVTLDKFIAAYTADLNKYQENLAKTRPNIGQQLIQGVQNNLGLGARGRRYASTDPIEKWIDA